jgi:hypothetical protein
MAFCLESGTSLPDTKLTKNIIQYIFIADIAGYFGDIVQAAADVQRHRKLFHCFPIIIMLGFNSFWFSDGYLIAILIEHCGELQSGSSLG